MHLFNIRAGALCYWYMFANIWIWEISICIFLGPDFKIIRDKKDEKFGTVSETIKKMLIRKGYQHFLVHCLFLAKRFKSDIVLAMFPRQQYDKWSVRMKKINVVGFYCLCRFCSLFP